MTPPPIPTAIQEAAAETQGLPKPRLRNRRQERFRGEASANWRSASGRRQGGRHHRQRNSHHEVFVELTKNDESKEVFRITHVTVESKKRWSKRTKSPSATGVSYTDTDNGTATKLRYADALVKCALCQGLHTANYKGYPKSPYVKKGKAPVQSPKAAKVAAPKPVQRPAQRKLDVAKKDAAKKTKASNKDKTPSTPSGPKPSPKKLVASQRPTKPSQEIVKEVADYGASETTSRPVTDVMSTLSQLIPLIQKINWPKLFEIAATLLPKLLSTRRLGNIAQRPGYRGYEGCRPIPPVDRSQRALIRSQPSAAITWAGDGPIQLETVVRQVTERVSDRLRYATNTSCAVNATAFIPSPRPNTGEEQGPKTVAEKSQLGSQSGV
ncbi:hypothetical protein Trydic_g16238 [Trypoxylus dichotomus]